jgi:hypothetical protein
MAMPIEGFLDAVERLQIRGWAFDPSHPTEAVRVQLVLDDTPLAEGLAELYRADLEKSGIGNGYHAFVLNLDRELKPDEIERVRVRASSAGGDHITLQQATPDHSDVETAPLHQPIEFTSSYSDATQQPVFILGAARSGTSAVAQALLKLGCFEGHEEGHMLDLLAHFAVTLRKFYEFNGDELSPERNTTIARVPPNFYQESLDAVFIDLAHRLFPTSRWIDKTPNSDMVYLAPLFKKIWPHSRFIFMRRRFLENAMSRSRKFPEHEFERAAKEWAAAMGAWMGVRSQLGGIAVEIDQKFLNEEPEVVSKRLAQFLSLTKREETLLSQALRYDHPQRTSPTTKEVCDISQMDWGEVEHDYFDKYCSRIMEEFGYSKDSSYYLSGSAADGFVCV